jgi:hypothetical protein
VRGSIFRKEVIGQNPSVCKVLGIKKQRARSNRVNLINSVKGKHGSDLDSLNPQINVRKSTTIKTEEEP